MNESHNSNVQGDITELNIVAPEYEPVNNIEENIAEQSQQVNLPPILARKDEEAKQANYGKQAFVYIAVILGTFAGGIDALFKILKFALPTTDILSFVQNTATNLLTFATAPGIAWTNYFDNYITYTGNTKSDGIKQIDTQILQIQAKLSQTTGKSVSVLEARKYLGVSLLTAISTTVISVVSFAFLTSGTLDGKIKPDSSPANNTINNGTASDVNYESVVTSLQALVFNLIGNVINVAALLLTVIVDRYISPKLESILERDSKNLDALKHEW